MYCLDTNIIIFALKKQSDSALYQKMKTNLLDQNLGTTTISSFELLYYSYKNEATKSLEMRKNFLNMLDIFSFDYHTSEIAAKLKVTAEKKGETVDILDLQIASICLANDLILVTNNIKHFKNIPDLKLEDWT